ncbi:hypothetical protein Cgig2_028013 [Carnegiea gigantea]|uniref:Uncharacterized protein n=1 Tax=Carnegiea gigantea TaxID=171969 RepID=A0A9Q1JPV2_9CARY|nr:hypothetical protein Cgig2_028013 [Carnegiea gigantea]
MTYHCDCQLEAKIVEHHDNYRGRYACCPKQDEYACGYFEEVDPQYPSRAMEVIDDLVADVREARDVLLEERNNQYWIEEEDRAVEDGMRAELDELKGVVGVAFATIVVLVAALLTWTTSSAAPVATQWTSFQLTGIWVDHPLTRAEKVSVLNVERENWKLKAALLSKYAMLRAVQSQQHQKPTAAAAIVQLMHAVLTMTMFVVAYVVIRTMCA